MALGTAHTIALQGALGHLIDVQADVSPGSPGTTLVGRPDVSLNEARDRCRMAISNSHVLWPGATRRVTILLAPSDLVSRFFEAYPNYPLTRVGLDPGEGVWFPRADVVHDGWPGAKQDADVVLTIRGEMEEPIPGSVA